MKNMFKQSAFVVVEVKTVKKEAKTTKAGKPYDMYSIFGTTVKEGVGITIRKSVYNPDTIPDFVLNKIVGYEVMKDKKDKKEKVFAYVMVNPATKDGKVTMYDKVSTYSTDAGRTGIVVEAWATEIGFEETDAGMIFKFKNSTKTKDECETTIEVDMLVSEIDGNRISLIDDETSDFPVLMDVYLKDGVDNNAKVSQGYRFAIGVEKGKKVVDDTSNLDWDAEAKVNYAPDILRVQRVGKIKDYVSGNDESDGMAYTSEKGSSPLF